MELHYQQHAETPPALFCSPLKWEGVGLQEPTGRGGGTLLPSGSDEPRCWWASTDSIAENGYNLAAGRYKPKVAEQTPEEDLAELNCEVLSIEREIVEGLEKLLKEVEA